MFCKECGSEINDMAAVCVHCGVATEPRGARAGFGAKSRVGYILLGLLPSFFGLPGIHNLYAGYTARGVIQLCLTVLSCWLLWPVVLIWVIVDVCVIDVDGDGNPMTG